MAKKPLPDAELLRQLLEYDAETGLLKWRERDSSHFADARRCSIWNAKYAGTRAGQSRKYVIVKILGVGYVAHRIIWKMVHGVDPDEIDHINRDKLDNRLINLRDVDHAVNMRNRPIGINNMSGEQHIHWCARMGRWVVQVSVPGKGQRQVAWERSMENAIKARDAAYLRYGYSK